MPYTVSATFETAAEALAFLSGASPRAQATIAASEAVEKAQAAKPTPAVKPKAEKPAPVPVAAPEAPAPVASAPAASAPKVEPVPAAALPTTDYPSLQKSVFKLAGLPEVGRAAATALLEQFAVKTFKDLPPALWADALAAVDAKIAELTPVAA